MAKMTRRTFLSSTAALTGAAAVGADGGRRPNLVLVTSDQQHWQAAGHTDPFFDTPHLDALAQESVVFDHAHCTTPQCSPSRATLYTGLYPHKTGVTGNLGSIDHEGEPIGALERPSIAQPLQAAGYATAYAGKWHLGHHDRHAAHFDLAGLDSHHGDDPAVGDQAIKFLHERQGADKPFALFVNFLNPHDIYHYGFFDKPDQLPAIEPDVALPKSWALEDFDDKPPVQEQFMTDDQGRYIWDKPEPFWRYYRQFYREKVRLFDEQLGRVVEALRSLGELENTVLAVCSDHGDMDTHNRLIYKGPFMYEHMVRVPMLVRMPQGLGQRQERNSGLIELTDLAPTLLDFAGASGYQTDGRSQADCLAGRGPMAERDAVFSQYFNKQRWVNPIRMVRTKRYKYNRYLDYMDELYDLEADPFELTNLIGDPERAGARQELAAKLDAWMAKHGDPFTRYHSTTREGAPL